MSRRNRQKAKKQKQLKIGLPQGASVYIGEERNELATLELISYNYSEVSHQKNIAIDQLKNLDPDQMHWIDVNGIHDVNLVHDVCALLGIHSLTEEDILNSLSRPKCEIMDDYIYSGLKMLKNEKENVIIEDEQVSIILKENMVITFQEVDGDVFEPIRQRLKISDSRLRRKKSDYLFLSIHDIIVDNYICIIDMVEEVNQNIEAAIMDNPREEILNQIQALKTDLLLLKKFIFPVRESVNKIMRSESQLIAGDNLKYFNDLYDHLIYATENIDMQREIVISQRELYMSYMSNKMNGVMQVLTIVTTIFIPLSFIAGIYGMNFDVMPELKWKFGYFSVLLMMLFLAAGMMIYFRKKRWI